MSNLLTYSDSGDSYIEPFGQKSLGWYSTPTRPPRFVTNKLAKSNPIASAAKEIGADILREGYKYAKDRLNRTSFPKTKSIPRSVLTNYPVTSIPKPITLRLPQNMTVGGWTKEELAARAAKGPKKSRGTYVRQSPGTTLALANVSAPAAKTRRLALKSNPRMSTIDRGISVVHSEYMAPIDVTGATYSAKAYVINPGNASAFPWLSNIAVNYDRYRFKYLRFTYISSQPTSVGGKIGIGYDYDSTDVPPASRREFYSLTHHVETMPWDSCEIILPVDKNIKFINSHTTTDSKLIDCGQVFFMNDGLTATGLIGDVLVEYAVDLLDPQQAVYATAAFYATNPVVTSPFTTAFTLTGPINFCRSYGLTSTVITFTDMPMGRYLAMCYVNDSAANPTVTGGGTSISSTWNQSTTAANYGMCNTIFTTTDTTNALTFTLGTTASWADCEYVRILITRVSPALTI